MRHTAKFLLATAPLLAALTAPAALAETRVIARVNGWMAFGGTTGAGLATCGLETRDPNTGRHFLLQQIVGQDRPILRLSRPGWDLRGPATRPVRIVIDNRRVIAGTATGAGREMSWPLNLEGPNGFEAAFRQGTLMRVEFPTGQDSPWHLSLGGTNAVMGAFVGCMRMMVVQPGEAPPPPAGPQPIQPAPSLEPPPLTPSPLAPPVEAPRRPPTETPATLPQATPPQATPPSTGPRPALPQDKPARAEPDGKGGPAGKPTAPASRTAL